MTTPTREQVVQMLRQAGFVVTHDGWICSAPIGAFNVLISEARADLEAELESLRKDAERYQFIACQADEVTGHVFAWQTDCCDRGVRDVSLDALIDSAIDMVRDRSLEKKADAALAQIMDRIAEMTTPTREQDNELLALIQRHFPSLPTGNEYTNWKKWLDFAQAAFSFGASSARADLEAELESLRKDAWISVDDRLPEPEVSVLVTREGKQFATKTCHDGREWLLESIHYPVTHWMPLPAIAAAPKEK